MTDFDEQWKKVMGEEICAGLQNPTTDNNSHRQITTLPIFDLSGKSN